MAPYVMKGHTSDVNFHHGFKIDSQRQYAKMQK